MSLRFKVATRNIAAIKHTILPGALIFVVVIFTGFHWHCATGDDTVLAADNEGSACALQVRCYCCSDNDVA
jgi:hypothetical protein